MDAEMIQKLSDSGIDYEAGIDRFGGNEALFDKFIRRFSDDVHYGELCEALAAGDTEAGFRIAHTLKGVVGNLSFSTYYEAITPVAELLREGDIEHARALMPSVEVAHASVIQALQEI